ncbi:transforming growth factor-beta-induced protein ig-h3-like [Mercenaria mercenaria]|uniref:transforming growth factor-beta-induced protein ig-h3-like n=1 Tax=Mercenaria mercenaria TaxID=6596 RepID=UPI00234F2325|nr:transforming growth factor-beta-induced protein ig-h3-like [Mercenaria mercenaria]
MIGLKTVFLFVNALAFSAALSNIVDSLTANNATTLVNLIDQAGLTDTLKNKGPFTIFAPTNAAIGKVPAADLQALSGDANALQNVLLYHVVNGDIFSWDLRTGERLTSLNNHTIRVYSSGGKHYFNQALAVVEEIQASNGVIYLIDEVLNVPEGTIWDILNNPDYNLTEFANAAQHARLDSMFKQVSSTSRYTVFAPMNSAFQSLPTSLVNKILSSITYGRYIVDYHTHRGTLHASSLAKDGSVSTLHTGHVITISHDANTGEPLLNKLAHVVIQDIEAENGVVHVITHVLIPSSLAGIVG